MKIGCALPGLTSGYGPSHQATEDLALFRAMPNMVVIDPCDAHEIEQVVPAIAAHRGPVYMRLLRGQVPVVLDEYDNRFEQLFPWFVMAGVALAVQHGGHIAVEWLLGRLGRGGTRVLLLAGHISVVGTYITCCSAGCRSRWPRSSSSSGVRRWGCPRPTATGRSPEAGLGCPFHAVHRTTDLASGVGGNAAPDPRGDPHMSLALILAFIVLMVVAIPVAHALIVASGIALLWDGKLPLLLVVQQMFQRTQSFPMLALPFFILAGTLIMEGRLGEELLRFTGELMQRVRDGALSTTVVGSVVFGGVSGSAVANASALGSVLN